tara:strand:- start:263 stop:1048 length:786 start_codon:yes stop_codon:yes gene_type:complete
MPNHVFCTISVEDKYIPTMKKIAKLERGLAEFITPMPKELLKTSAPQKIISQEEYNKQEKRRLEWEKQEPPKNPFFSEGVTLQIQAFLLENYGSDNWYDWALKNWGTKWGCYDNDVQGNNYHFTTAWGTLNDSILEEFAKVIPDFSYFYEEEQGWGGNMEFENGECVVNDFYDIPPFNETKSFWINDKGVIKEDDTDVGSDFEFLCEVTYLTEDYYKLGETYAKGWYEHYGLEEFIAPTIKGVLEFYTHKDRKGNQPIIFG